jgi:hypothetical protein
MKIKIDFITNSSSTAYMIYNTSNEKKTLVDFALENIHLLDQFLKEYDWNKDDPRYSVGSFLESAARNNIEFDIPGDGIECVFGDEDGTVIGTVYDYILRDGGTSENFTWRFRESLR